jgi:hypothetical protein
MGGLSTDLSDLGEQLLTDAVAAVRRWPRLMPRTVE